MTEEENINKLFMTPTDEQILEAYHQGFKDELKGIFDIENISSFSNSIYKNRAYVMGSNHAMDSVLDDLSDQEILKRIK